MGVALQPGQRRRRLCSTRLTNGAARSFAQAESDSLAQCQPKIFADPPLSAASVLQRPSLELPQKFEEGGREHTLRTLLLHLRSESFSGSFLRAYYCHCNLLPAISHRQSTLGLNGGLREKKNSQGLGTLGQSGNSKPKMYVHVSSSVCPANAFFLFLSFSHTSRGIHLCGGGRTSH